MPLFRKKTKVYNVRIFSDHNIKSKHQFNIDVHSNIITIMQIFKQFCVGNVHAIAVQYSQNQSKPPSLSIKNIFNITNKHPHLNTSLFYSRHQCFIAYYLKLKLNPTLYLFFFIITINHGFQR